MITHIRVSSACTPKLSVLRAGVRSSPVGTLRISALKGVSPFVAILQQQLGVGFKEWPSYLNDCRSGAKKTRQIFCIQARLECGRA
jgi:hypothetical protein